MAHAEILPDARPDAEVEQRATADRVRGMPMPPLSCRWRRSRFPSNVCSRACPPKLTLKITVVRPVLSRLPVDAETREQDDPQEQQLDSAHQCDRPLNSVQKNSDKKKSRQGSCAARARTDTIVIGRTILAWQR